MTRPSAPATKRGFGVTARKDRWWLTPVLTFLGLSAFIIYSMWAALQGEHYAYGPYLSPFYSPLIFSPDPHHLGHSWFGENPTWYPFSLAFLILRAPAAFRFTCYYYRGAYYKPFWAAPPSCAVGEPRKSYLGENSFPLILQNVHRYFLYVAMLFLVLLAYDTWKAMWFETENGVEFGIGVGTLVLAVNVILLSGYTLGCHSLCHFVGGLMNRISGTPVRMQAYRCVSCLNHGHMRWAWCSLF
jgi:hypothetical protein